MRPVNQKAKHVIVISYDAFSEDQWELAKSLPNLSALIQKGACSSHVKSVYPTLTYVVHATMVTGMYPGRHRVFHNNPFQPFVPENMQHWFWYRNQIKAPTIYDDLKAYGMKSAALLWPTTGKSAINYNIPEIRALGKENQAIKVMKSGSPVYCLQMEKRFGKMRQGIRQPFLDDFTTACAVDTIKRKKPNLFLIHLIDLDDAKHESGTKSDEVEQAVHRMDKRIGDLVTAVKEAGIEKDTVFIVIGDHGQLDVRYKIRLNNLLEKHHLLGTVTEENENSAKKTSVGAEKLRVTDNAWKVYVQGAGGAAYLYCRPGENHARELALEVLQAAVHEESLGIERVYTRDEFEKLQIDSDAEAIIEARPGFCFDDSVEMPLIVDLEHLGKRYATHGYLPEKEGYHTNIVLSGECMKEKYTFGPMDMVDLAPTIADILGIEFGPCDGHDRKDLFK